MDGHPAPEAARIDPEPARPANGYDWDRTIPGTPQFEHEDPARAAQSVISKTPWPTPKNTTLTFAQLCEYYNALRELPTGRYARLYVARWWPVLLPVEAFDDFGNPKDSFPNDVKITAEDGALSQQLILQLAGVGEYRFRLNDSRRPWKQQTVVFSELELIDATLWTLHPPIIDAKRLDLDAKRNQAYIKFARAHGYLPREGEEEKEQANVAQVAAIDSVLEDSRRERARTDQLQREALDRAQAEAREAKEAAATLRNAKTEDPKPAAPASDLLNVVTSVATLAKSLQPAKDDSLSEYLKLQQEREKSERDREKEERAAARADAAAERKRADDLQAEVLKELRDAAKPPATGTAVTPAAPPTEVDMLERMVRQQALLKQLTGRGGSAAEVEEAKPSSVDKWLDAAPIIAPIFGQFVSGFFQTILAGFQSWQLNHYNDAVARSGGTPKPPQAMTENKQQPTEPGKPIAPQAPAPSPEDAARQQQWTQIMQGMQMLAPHLVRHLDKGRSGAELAEFVIENADEQRTSYERIRHVADSLALIGVQAPGGTDLEKFISAARFVFEKIPPLWAKVSTLPTMPQFLTEFYNYDEILRKEEENQQR